MTNPKPKKRKKWTWLRYRKNDLPHNVQVAVQRWVHGSGGTVTVMGGVSIIEMPGARPGQYYIAVACIGQRPLKYPQAQNPTPQTQKKG